MKISSKEIIKLRAELNSKKKPLHTTKEIKFWYRKIIKQANIKIKTIPLKKCNSWKMNDNGHIAHSSGSFYKVEGVRVLKSFNREIKEGWDQPMFTEPGFDGGILGLLKKKINNMPHYLVNAKFEPGNYNDIQLSPSLQATYSNLNRVHLGNKPKVANKYFKKNFKTIRKFWVTEDGGRLFKKRNLHWIIQYNGKINLPGPTYKWLTLWELDKFIKMGYYVGPHLRSILSLI